MTARTASCRCNQLRATVTGEPVRLSVCHCLNCKKRSGSAFAVQARWPAERVQVEGASKTFEKAGDSGNSATFHFCPDCGSDVFYLIDGKFEGLVAIPLGADRHVFPSRFHEHFPRRIAKEPFRLDQARPYGRDPGFDPHLAPDPTPLWNILDWTPGGRGTDWYPKLEYTS